MTTKTEGEEMKYFILFLLLFVIMISGCEPVQCSNNITSQVREFYCDNTTAVINATGSYGDYYYTINCNKPPRVTTLETTGDYVVNITFKPR
jgi:hypothetical protein